MRARTTDPIGCVPSPRSVREALDEARRRVSTLEFLLIVSEGVEARLRGESINPASIEVKRK
jgi:hypothetical protein